MTIETPYQLSGEDVAELLGVSARRVRQIDATQLPYLQLAERSPRRYRLADVERYLEARRRSSRP